MKVCSYETSCNGGIKGKGKVRPRTGYEGPDGAYRYSSIFFNLGASWG